jgi:hypothetical protein
LEIEIGEQYKHLMCALFGISPALGARRIKKVGHQPIRTLGISELTFQNPGSLKFAQAFQLISREASEEVVHRVTVRRITCPKKGTDQRRAGGDSGQN